MTVLIEPQLLPRRSVQSMSKRYDLQQPNRDKTGSLGLLAAQAFTRLFPGVNKSTSIERKNQLSLAPQQRIHTMNSGLKSFSVSYIIQIERELLVAKIKSAVCDHFSNS